MVVWDVLSGQPAAVLDDPWLAATGKRGEAQLRSVGVKALAWVLPDPGMLAIALPNLLIIWDPEGAAGES